MQHVVMFSGGEGSAFTASLVAQQHGRENLRLLFTDTLAEDSDLYRFLLETAFQVFDKRCPDSLLALMPYLPEWHEKEKKSYRRSLLETIRSIMKDELPELIWLNVGLDPWELYKRERFLGNSRIDPCSKFLKRVPANTWLSRNCDPKQTIVYVGIDWTESHRFDDGKGRGLCVRRAQEGWTYEAPMCDSPFYSRTDAVEWLQLSNIERPRLTREGYSHNNCSGHCCKAGQGHWAHHLEIHPERFEFAQREEEAMRKFLNKNVAMMFRVRNKSRRPLTLAELHHEIDTGASIDRFEIGGCGCFIED